MPYADDTQEVLLQVKGLRTYFPVGGGRRDVLRAVDGVDLTLHRGETVGLVGESGSGKSTVARSIIRLEKPTDGQIIFKGVDLARASRRKLHELRPKVQMVFQDPFASLNPRMKVGDAVAEPLIIHERVRPREARKRAAEFLERVGLPPDAVNRYPHEFSGGQRQRIGIARALSVRPELILADEPVSALDVSIQGQLLNLFKDLQRDFNLTYLFISHDLSVVRYLCDRIAVMYLGQIAEVGDNASIFNSPRHPYTKALLSAVPDPDPARAKEQSVVALEGEVPSPMQPPLGCRFHTRCPVAIERCAHDVPIAISTAADHVVSCHLVEEPDDLAGVRRTPDLSTALLGGIADER